MNTSIRKQKWRGLEINAAVVLFGFRVTLSTMPFAWNRPLFSYAPHPLNWERKKKKKLHIYFGPFHLWTMESGCNQFAMELDFDHNPFWADRPKIAAWLNR
ncbi:hypothetical protein P12x_005347 [Tundrisphaera lichenicola]|uniref:hypothetical protein n=1 Tax=Tundrisphaera lichenicola TaxID=2029860 RepID=UPI003EB80194